MCVDSVWRELSTVLCAVMCRSAVYGVGDGLGGYMGCLRAGSGFNGGSEDFWHPAEWLGDQKRVVMLFLVLVLERFPCGDMYD